MAFARWLMLYRTVAAAVPAPPPPPAPAPSPPAPAPSPPAPAPTPAPPSVGVAAEAPVLVPEACSSGSGQVTVAFRAPAKRENGSAIGTVLQYTFYRATSTNVPGPDGLNAAPGTVVVPADLTMVFNSLTGNYLVHTLTVPPGFNGRFAVTCTLTDAPESYAGQFIELSS